MNLLITSLVVLEVGYDLTELFYPVWRVRGVSPHSSLASTALSPISSRGEIDCSPASPKINVEDLDDEDSIPVDMTNQNPLNLVQRPTSSESVWRPF